MHPDVVEIAAYLDGALPDEVRAGMRAHLLTCRVCSTKLDQLRQDAGRIMALAHVPAPDVRAGVRAKVRRPSPMAGLARGGMVAGGLVALLLFALLVGARSGVTVGWTPDRLFLLEQEQLIELDPHNGTQRNAVDTEKPLAIQYDPLHDRLYVLTSQGVRTVDTQTFATVAQWDAPVRMLDAQLLLDPAGQRLYVAVPVQQRVTQLDTPSLTALKDIELQTIPDALAIAPGGEQIYTYNTRDSLLGVLDVQSERVEGYSTPDQIKSSRAWLVASPNRQNVYLLTADPSTTLYRFELGSRSFINRATLLDGEPPWGLVHLPDGRLAVPRGDGDSGGVELYDATSLALAQRLDPDSDQHHLIAGPKGSVFAFRWAGAVTRYNLANSSAVWRASIPGRLVDGIFVQGGWKFEWER